MSQFKGFRKKKDTTPNFLHRVPKKDEESEYDINFGQILANKIRNGFCIINCVFCYNKQ